MIYKDCYKTSIGLVYNTKPIENAIRESIISDGISKCTLNVDNKGKFKPIYITGFFQSEVNIPLFTHPISILNFNHNNYLCTDLRLYIRKDNSENLSFDDYVKNIKNLTEFNFVKSRSIINLLWLNDEINYIQNNLSFAGDVYAAWLSDIISKAFNLDYNDKTIISVLAYVFYYSLFHDVLMTDEEEKQKLAIHIIKNKNLKAEYILDILDKIEKLADINDFCNTVSRVVENIRLKDFKTAILLTLIRNSWYAINAKEILSVALEHPPTWAAIVYAVLNDRSYKNTIIFKYAEQLGKKGIADQYILQYKQLIDSELVKSTESIHVREFL